MAGAKKAASDYLEQTRSYDAGSPRTSVPDEQRKKKGFQPAEPNGMELKPSTYINVSAGDSFGSAPKANPSAPKTKKKPQYKDYGYSGNADRMSAAVNRNVAPDLFGSIKSNISSQYDPTAIDAFEKSRKGFSGRLKTPNAGLSPQKNFIDKAFDTLGSSPVGEERSLGNVLGDLFRKSGTAISIPGVEKDPAALVRSNYDETSWRNLQKPGVPGSATGTSNQSAPGPADLSKALDAAGQKNINRFDPSKLTIGNNEFTGQVGLFKDGQMLDSSKMRLSGGNLGGTPLPAGQQTTFNRISVPMPGGAAAPSGGAPAQPGASGFTGTTNYTNLFANDAKIDAMRLANAKNDYRIGEGNPRFFTGPGEPGAGNYAPGSATSQFQDRRNLVQAQLDEYNRRNPLASNASVGEIIAHQANTKSMRDEIQHIDEQIFGRTDLANKIMTALIGKDATLGAQALENEGKMSIQALENQSLNDLWTMREGEENKRHGLSLLFGGKAGAGKDPLADADIDFRKSSGLEMLKYMKENGATQDELSAFASDYSLKNFGRPRNEKEEDQKRVNGI